MGQRKGASKGRKLRPAQKPPAPPAPPTPPAKTPFQREQTTKRRGELSELAFALKATSLGFGVSRPYGDSERYDVVLDCHNLDCHNLDCHDPENNFLDHMTRPRLIRVQVKASAQLVDGLYRVNAHRRIYGRAVPYKLSEIDFIAAHVIPEDTWYILPLAHVLGLTSLLFRPKRTRRRGPYHRYREAWHLLRQPDGLVFA